MIRLVLITALGGVLGFSLPALAATLHVANTGSDSSACGPAPGKACRSISQAIANAHAGDTIRVGPGLYGDLNGDGVLGGLGSGEEAGDAGRPYTCGCMISVDKGLRIVSTDGALATVVDAGNLAVDAVRIVVGDVVFGQRDRGFQVKRAGDPTRPLTVFNGAGVSVSPTVDNVVIEGNLATDNRDGFRVEGGVGHRVRGNLALGNRQWGFESPGGHGHEYRANGAASNGYDGFLIAGAEHLLVENVAVGNGRAGIALLSPSRASAIKDNAITGNRGPGIDIPPGCSTTIRQNNIYGNHTTPLDGRTNCGVLNRGDTAIPALGNFWGGPGGPGPDPADQVCDVSSGTTAVNPFAIREFTITLRPVR